MTSNNTSSTLLFWNESVPSYRSYAPQKEGGKDIIFSLIVLCIAMINAIIFMTLFCYQMRKIGKQRHIQQKQSHCRVKLLNKPTDMDITLS